jgi:hypothetical protein
LTHQLQLAEVFFQLVFLLRKLEGKISLLRVHLVTQGSLNEVDIKIKIIENKDFYGGSLNEA